MAAIPVGQQGYVNPNSSTGLSSKGTKIVKSDGSDMDKNAFLKILCAELANQNPENATDGTQYVAQLAQFSSLEQMSNLSTSMEFNNASNLVGKAVVMDAKNANGENYAGVVTGISRNGSKINVELKYGTGDNDVKEFSIGDVIEVCAS